MLKSHANQKTRPIIIKMIIEGEDGLLFGRVNYDDDLIVDSAPSLAELENKMRALLLDFHELEPDSYQFQLEYDLTSFFEQFDFLKITKIAELSGLNGSLVRQYASGKKFPSAKQAEKIERAIKDLAQQLLKVHIYTAI